VVNLSYVMNKNGTTYERFITFIWAVSSTLIGGVHAHLQQRHQLRHPSCTPHSTGRRGSRSAPCTINCNAHAPMNVNRTAPHSPPSPPPSPSVSAPSPPATRVPRLPRPHLLFELAELRQLAHAEGPALWQLVIVNQVKPLVRPNLGVVGVGECVCVCACVLVRQIDSAGGVGWRGARLWGETVCVCVCVWWVVGAGQA
jgi:hypothetical protein